MTERPKPPAAGKGRKPGSKNKAGSTAKDAILAVFEQLGGIPAMTQWALSNPEQFYTKLWAKIVPTEVAGKMQIEVSHPQVADESQLASNLAAVSKPRAEAEQPSVH